MNFSRRSYGSGSCIDSSYFTLSGLGAYSISELAIVCYFILAFLAILALYISRILQRRYIRTILPIWIYGTGLVIITM